jgi:hypothetical protein
MYYSITIILRIATNLIKIIYRDDNTGCYTMIVTLDKLFVMARFHA